MAQSVDRNSGSQLGRRCSKLAEKTEKSSTIRKHSCLHTHLATEKQKGLSVPHVQSLVCPPRTFADEAAKTDFIHEILLLSAKGRAREKNHNSQGRDSTKEEEPFQGTALL